jgi:two-component system, NtrC family, response regulator GlrR
MSLPKVLILCADSSESLCGELQGVLDSSPVRLHVRRAAVEAGEPGPESGVPFRELSGFQPQLVILALAAATGAHADKLLQRLKAYLPGAPVILVTDGDGAERITALLRLGFSDFITAPLKSADLFPRIWRLLEQPCGGPAAPREVREQLQLRQLVGGDREFVAEVNKIPTISKYDSSVLILGETGTGKEVCARAIHHLSSRADKPFVPVNCAAIPVELIENELFGHERGAYTNAYASQPGLVREADGGTILLDEIDSLPLLAQVKLLRFIQDKAYRPLGTTKSYQADVRVIAATNACIEQAIAEGRFRQDLFYRINVVQLRLPPLRDRKGDIPLLARHFLKKLSHKFNKQVTDFSAGALNKLMSHDWPGNVRELEHIIERAVILSEQRVITDAELPLQEVSGDTSPGPFREAKSRAIDEFERQYLETVLIHNQGNITRAARAARKNRRAFFELIRKHRIDVQSLKGARKDIGM